LILSSALGSSAQGGQNSRWEDLVLGWVGTTETALLVFVSIFVRHDCSMTLFHCVESVGCLTTFALEESGSVYALICWVEPLSRQGAGKDESSLFVNGGDRRMNTNAGLETTCEHAQMGIRDVPWRWWRLGHVDFPCQCARARTALPKRTHGSGS